MASKMAIYALRIIIKIDRNAEATSFQRPINMCLDESIRRIYTNKTGDCLFVCLFVCLSVCLWTAKPQGLMG